MSSLTLPPCLPNLFKPTPLVVVRHINTPNTGSREYDKLWKLAFTRRKTLLPGNRLIRMLRFVIQVPRWCLWIRLAERQSNILQGIREGGFSRNLGARKPRNGAEWMTRKSLKDTGEDGVNALNIGNPKALESRCEVAYPGVQSVGK